MKSKVSIEHNAEHNQSFITILFSIGNFSENDTINICSIWPNDLAGQQLMLEASLNALLDRISDETRFNSN